MPAWSAVGWVDWCFLFVLAASVAIGVVRGIVFELLSLAGWVVAWFAAVWGAPLLAPHLTVFAPGSAWHHVASFALAFFGVLLAWSLMARLVRWLVHATPLSVPDRLLGACFGLLRGAVLLLALATVVALTPASQSGVWRASTGAAWLDGTLRGLKPLLPPAAARLLPA